MACLTACLFFSCGKKKANDPLGDNGRTKRTENLLAHLASNATKGFLFGQQDATLSKESSSSDSTQTDIKSVCGDSPALVGFDIGGIETSDSLNIYSTPFSLIREQMVSQFDKGGVVTVSWQCKSPGSIADIMENGSRHEEFLSWIDRAAEFLASLETPYGVRVPVIFRPWHENGEKEFGHENGGKDFWWTSSHCSREQYLALWQMTKERFEKVGATNVLFAFSPLAQANASESKYLERYPGDDLIDILGINLYCHAEEGDSISLAKFSQTLSNNLKMLTTVGKRLGKPIAVTETGYQGIKSNDWWTKTLLPAIAPYPISYIMLWRTDHGTTNHYYVPFPGQRSAENFVSFYNAPNTLFLHDINGLYL